MHASQAHRQFLPFAPDISLEAPPHLKHLLELAQAVHGLHGVQPRHHGAARVPLAPERLGVRDKGAHLLDELALEADLGGLGGVGGGAAGVLRAGVGDGVGGRAYTR